jgi:tyrosyl-tRNA synthetase
MGGSDQWGNITAGCELIRRAAALRLRAGLAAGDRRQRRQVGQRRARDLSHLKTSPYRFYQFWLNTADADAIQYLRASPG